MFFFYRPFINGLSTQLQILVFLFIPIVFLSLKYRYIMILGKNIVSNFNVVPLFLSSLLFISVFCGSLITLFVNQTSDLTYISRLINIPIVTIGYIFIYALIDSYGEAEKPLEAFISLFINVTCFYVLFTVIITFFPSIREIWFNIFQFSETGAELYANHSAYTFRIGWNGFAGFGNTFMCTIAIILQILTLEEKKANYQIIDWIKIIILLVGNAFYGRIGLLLSMLILVCFYFFKAIKIISLKFILGAFVFIIIIYGLLQLLISISPDASAWLDWIVDPFNSIIYEGKIGQETMFNMYFLPDLKTLLIGDGLYTMLNGSYYMEVDVGYMRPVLYFGMIFTVLNYINILILQQNFAKYTNLKYTYLIFLIVLIFEIKGEVIFNILPLLWALNIMLSYEKSKQAMLQKYSKKTTNQSSP